MFIERLLHVAFCLSPRWIRSSKVELFVVKLDVMQNIAGAVKRGTEFSCLLVRRSRGASWRSRCICWALKRDEVYAGVV